MKRTLVIALSGSLLFVASHALALEPAERELLLRSLRPPLRATVDKAVGGLDTLPFVAAEVRLDGRARTIDGHVRLDWRNGTGRPLHALPIRISANEGASSVAPGVSWTGVTVAVDGKDPVPAKVERRSATIVRVSLPAALAPGKRVVLSGKLDGVLAHVPEHRVGSAASGLSALVGGDSGQGASQYGTFSCGAEICTLSGFVPEVPAFIDGAFDESAGSGIGDATYSEPVNVLLSVVTAAGWTVAATGIEVGTAAEGEGMRRTTFALAAGREVGVVASPRFELRETTLRGVTVRSLSRPGSTGAGEAALDAAKGGLDVFDKALGQYPWSVLTVAESALTGGAGGLELPTLALIASGLYSESAGGMLPFDLMANVRGNILDFVVLHEVAHQWWHAQVGSHAQRHPWVDEPLAQYSALVANGRLRGKEARERARTLQVALNFQALGMFGVNDGTVARPAGQFASQLEYAGLVYGKAPLFYDAAAGLMGEEKLLGTLKEFVERHRFARVTPAQLRDALVKGAGSRGPQVSALWTRWFEQAHGVVDVGRLDLAALLELAGGPAGGLPPGLLGGDAADLEGLIPSMEKALDSARQLLEEFRQQLEE